MYICDNIYIYIYHLTHFNYNFVLNKVGLGKIKMKSWELFIGHLGIYVMMKSEVLKGRSRYLRLWHDLFAWWHEMSASRVQFFCYVSVCHMCIISVVAVQKQDARFTGAYL